MRQFHWRFLLVALVLIVGAARCSGGHGVESFDNSNTNDNAPSVGNGSAAAIEFVAPDTSGGTTGGADDGIDFESAIGPAGSANAQASRVRFRVLNASGGLAKDGIRVDFRLEGPPDASLTLANDKTQDGFVDVVVRPGVTEGNATVVATVRDSGLTARSAVIAIAHVPAPADSIEFFTLRVPAFIKDANDNPGTPQSRTQLGLRGSGFAQAVDVVFAVLDARGGPAADGTIVDFSLFGPNGGESISPVSGATSQGFVSATISTGTRPGPVEVTAQVRGTSIHAQAIPITIGTSLNPPAGHLSIAAECLNVSGSAIFGIEDDIRAGLSDQFGNPVPLSSAVSFFTEGGGVQAQGLTDDKLAAHATLVTQAPLPSDHRVTVLAVTSGQEPFTDLNGNGQFDLGEPFVDLPQEVFLDADEDGVYELGEFFIDRNNNGVYDGAGNGVWDAQLMIAADIPLVFSGHTRISVLSADGFDIDPSNAFDLAPGDRQEFIVIVADEVGAPLVGGTKIKFATTGGVIAPAEITIPDTNADTRLGPIEGRTAFRFVLTNAQPQPSPTPTPGAPSATATPAADTAAVVQADRHGATVTITVDAPDASDTKCPGSNGDATLVFSGFLE